MNQVVECPLQAKYRNNSEMFSCNIILEAIISFIVNDILHIHTHVPGAHKHRDDIQLRLLGVSSLHKLQQPTKSFSFLWETHQCIRFRPFKGKPIQVFLLTFMLSNTSSLGGL